MQGGHLQEHGVQHFRVTDAVDRVGIWNRREVQKRLHSEYVVLVPNRRQVLELLNNRGNLAVSPLLDQVKVASVYVRKRRIISLSKRRYAEVLKRPSGVIRLLFLVALFRSFLDFCNDFRVVERVAVCVSGRFDVVKAHLPSVNDPLTGINVPAVRVGVDLIGFQQVNPRIIPHMKLLYYVLHLLCRASLKAEHVILGNRDPLAN